MLPDHPEGPAIMLPTPYENDRGLLKAIAMALTVKLAALAVLYFAFFVPPAAPSPSHVAAAVLGLADR
jgi:hypothetical protein